jgi:hypothetical protein
MNLNMPQFTTNIQQTNCLLQIRNADWPLLMMATNFCPLQDSSPTRKPTFLSLQHQPTQSTCMRAHASHKESGQNISRLTDRRRGRAALFIGAVCAVRVSITASRSQDTASKVTYELALSTLYECTHKQWVTMTSTVQRDIYKLVKKLLCIIITNFKMSYK